MARGNSLADDAPARHARRMSDAVGTPVTVVLVEGASDRAALHALARARGADLVARRVHVVPTGGATSTARFVRRLLSTGDRPDGAARVRLAGLVDAAEERYTRGALERAGRSVAPGREALAGQGFHVCDPDLEHELVRALGVARAEQVLADHGDLGRFRTLQQQPAQAGRDPVAQLCRWVGAGSGRKLRYAEAFAAALPADAVPDPLAALLDDVLA